MLPWLAALIFLSAALAKECRIGEQDGFCLLYLGAQTAASCTRGQMALGARTTAASLHTTAEQPCLALVPTLCESVSLPQCHSFEAERALALDLAGTT